jgi:hypothetical protein
LGVDADAVLPDAISFERFKTIAGWDAKGFEVGGGVEEV